MTDKLTTKCYNYATICVDEASKVGYVCMRKTTTCKEIVESNKAFEYNSMEHGVTIKADHTDNGIFRVNDWQKSCRDAKQTLTFAGVIAHHTNSLAENYIIGLQDLTKTSLIHSPTRWQGYKTANL